MAAKLFPVLETGNVLKHLLASQPMVEGGAGVDDSEGTNECNIHYNISFLTASMKQQSMILWYLLLGVIVSIPYNSVTIADTGHCLNVHLLHIHGKGLLFPAIHHTKGESRVLDDTKALKDPPSQSQEVKKEFLSGLHDREYLWTLHTLQHLHHGCPSAKMFANSATSNTSLPNLAHAVTQKPPLQNGWPGTVIWSAPHQIWEELSWPARWGEQHWQAAFLRVDEESSIGRQLSWENCLLTCMVKQAQKSEWHSKNWREAWSGDNPARSSLMKWTGKSWSGVGILGDKTSGQSTPR